MTQRKVLNFLIILIILRFTVHLDRLLNKTIFPPPIPVIFPSFLSTLVGFLAVAATAVAAKKRS